MTQYPFRADPANWSQGPMKVYFARGDRRLFVRKYWGVLGWTVNFAHPLAFPIVVGLALAAKAVGTALT